MEDLHHEVDPLANLLPLLLPGMYERRWGRVVGIGMHPQKISPAYAYNLGKAARHQALLLASEQAWRHGVTINVVAPGPVSGFGSLEQAAAFSLGGEEFQARASVTPQDIAEGIAFLCSDAARYITGCVIPYLF